MKAILLVAHGSKRAKSNNEVISITEKLRRVCANQFSIVQAAFLEFSEISIPDGIKLCIEKGATSIVVLPYFLNSGKHLMEDIPKIVKNTAKKYPDIKIKIAPHIGSSDLIIDVLLDCVKKVEFE